jgi:glycerol-3-phosphate dehydrogenase (NAD(P)+)
MPFRSWDDIPSFSTGYPAAVARVTVFGAGAMGTAIAMHLARAGNETILWGSQYDERVLPDLTERRRHPNLPEFLPESLSVLGAAGLKEAAEGVDVAVLGAHSGGARTLTKIVMDGSGSLPLVLGIAKGLEPETGKRMSEVYAEEVGHDRVVVMGGPALAPEIAQGLPTVTAMASAHGDAAEICAAAFRAPAFDVQVTDDMVGLEYCTVAKNVAAIGMGVLDGIGKTGSADYRNAKAAMFTMAVRELTQLVEALGGRQDTVLGLAGLGDTLVTSLGGRNRLYGELIGEGVEPERALDDLNRRGMTVEGVDSAKDIRRLMGELGLELRLHGQIFRVLFESAPATSLLECITGDEKGTSA